MEGHPETTAEMFQRKLKVSAALAARLVASDLTSIEEVAYCPMEEFLEASGLEADEAQALRWIAKAYLRNEAIGGEFG
jgi:transcription termination/antitermination protein NusA